MRVIGWRTLVVAGAALSGGVGAAVEVRAETSQPCEKNICTYNSGWGCDYTNVQYNCDLKGSNEGGGCKSTRC
jgi:hypothetical protein